VKIALLGGSFNPIHNGHIFLADKFQEKFSDVSVHFIPSSLSVHKSNRALISNKHRLNMMRLALEGTSYKIEECELLRGGSSYTYDTLKELQYKYGEDTQFYILIGDDLVPGLSTWKEYSYLLKNSTFVVASRDKLSIPLPFGMIALENSIMDISSTQIRESVFKGFSSEKLVPNSVLDYILEKELYRSNG